MAQVSTQASLNGSRLLRVLNELAVADVNVSPGNFAERLGQLIDLADSVSIASVHGGRGATEFEPTTHSDEVITAEFLQVRNAIVGSIIKSFTDRSGLRRIKLPLAGNGPPEDPGTGYEPYGRFYAAHQREMDSKIQQLRHQVREAVAGASPHMAELAALDKALGDTLVGHSRKFFAAIPRLLGKRFAHLLEDYKRSKANPQDDSATWPEMLELFSRNMRGLLLAEVEARLLPTQGLIEALHSEIETINHE